VDNTFLSHQPLLLLIHAIYASDAARITFDQVCVLAVESYVRCFGFLGSWIQSCCCLGSHFEVAACQTLSVEVGVPAGCHARLTHSLTHCRCGASRYCH
jgi:hypothetical protein